MSTKKKVRTSLYISLIIRMLTSLLISVLIFVTLVIVSNLVIMWNESQIKAGYREGEIALSEMHTLAEEIQDEILSEEIPIEEAMLREWGTEKIEVIIAEFYVEKYLMFYFMGGVDDPIYIEGRTDGGLEYQYFDSSAIYEIQGPISNGYLLLYPEQEQTAEVLYTTIAALISIVVFFMLILKMIRPIVLYIKSIEQGVGKIANEDLAYKIEVVGRSELSSLAQEINAMGQQIYENVEKEKELDRNQRTLITNISHDLRTPLTSIIGYSDLIVQNTKEDEAVYEYASVLNKNALRLERLVEDLFLYTKLTSNDVKINMVRMDICLALRQTLELRSGEYHIKCRDEKLFAEIDPDKFHRIMENVFSNAEKHGTAGGAIDVEVKRLDENVIVIVKNRTKVNLSSKTEFLLERLYVANEERKAGSSGLGLSIVKELTERMNGTIEVYYYNECFEVCLSFSESK